MPMYNFTEYSDNYSDTSISLWQFKRDELLVNDAGNLGNVTTNNSTSFKYKSGILGTSTVADNGVLKKAQIAVPLNI